MTNPLLHNATLPLFCAIKPEHVEPAIDTILAHNRHCIAELINQPPPLAWGNLVGPLEALNDNLRNAWSPVSHLNAVMSGEALRDAHNACLPKLSEYRTEIGQHQGLFQGYKQLRGSDDYETLNQARQKALDNVLRDFHLSGVDLPPGSKKRYGEISKRLSELSARFSDNLLDATNGWRKHVANADALSGLPASVMAGLRQAAEREGLAGWLLTLDFPCFFPVMSYCDNPLLREEMYTAYCTRASDQGPHAGTWDNGPLMTEILALRHELAQLLGYGNYAERSLVTKMGESPQQVLDFLNDLAVRSRPAAKREFEELCAYAREKYGSESISAWDVTYYSEKLREEKYSINQEMLRPYFPLPVVLNGMFEVAAKLFGIEIVEKTDIDLWHSDARFFEVCDESGEHIAGFYLDPFARPKKRGGAWADDCRVRRRLEGGGLQLPVAFLVCNFTPPVGDTPALLTHNEVTTLFHEFGHGLHHMLTRIDTPSVAGINGVAWDAVELPSQFMENWCWQQEAIEMISSHYETGEPLPAELLEKMLAARNFQSGMQMVRQLEFALFDLRLHKEYDAAQGADIQAVLDDAREQVSVIKPPAFNRFQHSFSHIFSGSYAAGYYSYKWAEVLSADAFSKFEEDGIFNRETGAAFRDTILANGGAREPMELFKAFRGREPKVEPLLRHCGLAGQGCTKPRTSGLRLPPYSC